MTTLLNSSFALSTSFFASQPFLADLEERALSAPVLGVEAPEIHQLASRSLKGEVKASVVADRVWRNLAISFGRSVPDCRVVEGDTVEFHAVAHEFAVFDPIDIPFILGWMDKAFQGALKLIEKNGDEVIFRFPPLSHFEAGARQAFGSEAAHWYYVSGEISKEASNLGHAQRKQQIALPLKPLFFEQVNHVVPEFVYAIHDLNHAVDVAAIHPELLKIAVSLNTALFALPAEFQETDFVKAQLHDLSELFRVREQTLDGFLKRVFLPWEQEIRNLHYRLIPAAERGRILDLCRRYVPLIFDRWLPLLSDDRRRSIVSYRRVLDSLAESVGNP